MKEHEVARHAWRRHVDDVSVLLARVFADRTVVRVLEGGCGSGSYLTFPKNSRVTGIDLSPEQLRRNDRVHDRIVGNLETYEFEPRSFDVIVCWDVLEHLPNPGAALDRFLTAIAPGGLIVLGFPDRRSLKGWLTRALPHVVHVWFYRWVLGMRDAGKQDRGPFPTPMHPAMGRAAVIDRLKRSECVVLTDVLYESPMMADVRSRFGLVGRRWTAVQRALSKLVARRLETETTDCLLVLQKQS